MRASVQYNDYIGTAAADSSDHVNLGQFLQRRGVDIKRFAAIGAGFYSNYEDLFSGYVICKDNVKSTKETPHLVRIDFEEEITIEEFFSLFKRFQVNVSLKHGGYETFRVAEDLTCPDISKDEEE